METTCVFCRGNKKKSRKNSWGSCGGCLLLLWVSWALVQLLHVSEQTEFALWPSFHPSLYFNSSYSEEKKHRTASKAFWHWGATPELQKGGTQQVLLSVNCKILISGDLEVDMVGCQIFIGLFSLLAKGLRNYTSCMAGASIFGAAYLKIAYSFLKCAEKSCLLKSEANANKPPLAEEWFCSLNPQPYLSCHT